MIVFKKEYLKELPIKNILIIVFMLIALFSIRSCHENKISLSDKQKEADYYSGQSKAMTKEVNKLGQEVSSQELLLIQKDKQLEKQFLVNSNLKSLSSHYQVKLNTMMTNVSVGYIRDTVYKYVMTVEEARDKLSDTTEIVVVGTKFTKEDKWFSIKGSIQKDGINFDTLSIFNEPTLNIGYKRTSFFSKPQRTLEVINPNPYTNTIGMSNINFKDEPKFYQTRLFSFALGVISTAFAVIMIKK